LKSHTHTLCTCHKHDLQSVRVWLWLFEGFCCFKLQHFIQRERDVWLQDDHVSCAHKYFSVTALPPSALLFIYFISHAQRFHISHYHYLLLLSHLLIYFFAYRFFVCIDCLCFFFYVCFGVVGWFLCMCARSATMWN
jgi:hypothetical protein